jgi:hypothetical protein
MYPISVGQVCEWAGLKDCGGGAVSVVGCINNPATDLHHGPDKNTLNNEKGSRGIGELENVHVICSECHNTWHALNDEFYDRYNRNEQQTEPCLPREGVQWSQHEPSEATFEDLVEEEGRRHGQRKKRGREHRGRNGKARGEIDLALDDE